MFYHCDDRLGDPTSGAAIAASTMLQVLSRQGFRVGPSAADPAAARAEAARFVAGRQALGERRILIGFGGDPGTLDLFREAKRRGVVTVLHIHNFHYRRLAEPETVDHILVPSRFSADFYREALALDCQILPNLVDSERVVPTAYEPRYLTFVNPSEAKGVFVFARIADELGRCRPDIPLLVVESRSTEQTLAACGLDLRMHGTMNLMANTSDPRQFWRLTRACVMPSLWWESEGLVAVEAMLNGIPVIASDRGALPETLGDAGVVLPLPDRLTAATRSLPTPEEIGPWIESIIRLWDDSAFYAEQNRKALVEARRWAPEDLGARYAGWFRNLTVRQGPPQTPPMRRSKAIVLVPFLSEIEWECEQSLRKLEEAGVVVVRSRGSSQIDVVRNQLASDALHDGFESIFFIDADIGFDPIDALRLLARPEPVVSGVYAKKGRREMASLFADGIQDIAFGATTPGLYPLKYAATGFLRIRATVLRRMIETLGLPLCNAKWGRGIWPFFQPTFAPDDQGGSHYLGEDWAFSHRLTQIGVTPMADTSIRLWHYGRYAYGWEDAGEDRLRFPSYHYRATEPGRESTTRR